MNIFNIRKDINQFKQTKKEIKRAGKKIEEKSPLFGSIAKSISVIVKWLLIVGIIAGAILAIVGVIRYYTVVLPEEKTKKRGKKNIKIA